MNPRKPITASKATNKRSISSDAGRFPVVGIGASAGGLEALEKFFKNMPDNSGLAFVVIQHLDPNHKGIMPELLQRLTNMKVVQASDRLLVKPDCVYVIPPNKSLSLLKNSLHLFDPVESHGLRLPIDIFFRSLAFDRQEKSIGIILSGMGSDGSLGLKAIKEKNGIVLVQDPVTARFDGMPNSAIGSVIADIVAPAEELPGKLVSFLSLAPAVKTDSEIEVKTRSNIEKIVILLREKTGHDFSLYKKSTLLRRIERRKEVHQIDKIHNYVRFLQENPKEVEILFKEMLIGVTNFFRDNQVWIELRDIVLPEMLNRLPAGFVMRAWVPGCSTGEEAYSLAIVFKESIEKLKIYKNISLQIFATDLDKDAIEKARRGFFSKNISTDVSLERLERFFTPEDEGFHISSPIREMIVFAPQNVIKDPPFTKLQILTCRNMLIYMEPELQNRLIALFNYSLDPGGILVLGSAETLGNNNPGFEELNPKLKIFKHSAQYSTSEIMGFSNTIQNPGSRVSKKTVPTKIVDNIQTIADQLLLKYFSPASVLVNSKGDIIYITGKTGKYLEPVAGKANWNIYYMARGGLQDEMPGAFRKALQNYEPVILRNVKIETTGEAHFVDVTLQRIESPESVKDMILVVFTDVPAVLKKGVLSSKLHKTRSGSHHAELELELQRSFEETKSIREEMQTSQEELKSTNEELQSTNEELQSTNEELTTSREEMQSLNEELQTVNIELQSKISDLLQANDDMKNLLNSTEIATLFLDRELNIRRFTDPVAGIIKIRSSDVGRPYTDLVSNLRYPEMEIHTGKVLKTLVPIETPIKTAEGKWFNIRIMPYRTVDDRIDGLVITFTDITIAKKLEIELKKANEALLKIEK